MFSNSNNSFSQLHNRQKRPMYTGDSDQWPKTIQAIQVALMGLRIQVDPKKPESILPLQAMTYFRKCPVNSIPKADIVWTDWQAEDIIDAIETDSGPLPEREKELILELEQKIGRAHV